MWRTLSLGVIVILALASACSSTKTNEGSGGAPAGGGFGGVGAVPPPPDGAPPGGGGAQTGGVGAQTAGGGAPSGGGTAGAGGAQGSCATTGPASECLSCCALVEPAAYQNFLTALVPFVCTGTKCATECGPICSDASASAPMDLCYQCLAANPTLMAQALSYCPGLSLPCAAFGYCYQACKPPG